MKRSHKKSSRMTTKDQVFRRRVLPSGSSADNSVEEFKKTEKWWEFLDDESDPGSRNSNGNRSTRESKSFMSQGTSGSGFSCSDLSNASYNMSRIIPLKKREKKTLISPRQYNMAICNETTMSSERTIHRTVDDNSSSFKVDSSHEDVSISEQAVNINPLLKRRPLRKLELSNNFSRVLPDVTHHVSHVSDVSVTNSVYGQGVEEYEGPSTATYCKQRKTLPVSTNAKTEGKYQDTNDILIENQLASGSFSDAEVEDIDISDLLNRSGPVERKKFKSGRARDERKRLLALRPVEFEEILSERSDDDASLDEHDISHSTSPSEIHEQSGENDLRKYNKNYGEDSDHTGDKSPTMVERSGRKNYKRYGRKNFERSGRKSVVRSGRKNLERSGRKKFPENNENYSEIDGLSGNGGSETFERSGKKTLERSGRKIFAENNENYGDINELSGSGSPETSERSGRKNMEKSGRKNLEKSGRKNLEGSRRRFERSGRRKLSDNYDNRGENNVRLSKEQDLSSFNADGSSSIYESTKLEIPAYPCFASKRKRGNFDTFTDALNSESMAISQNSPDENVSGNSHSSYSSDANSSKSRKKLIFANEINGKNKPDGAMEGDIMQKKGKRSSKGSNSSKSDSVESQDSRVLQSYPALPKKKRKTLPVSTNAKTEGKYQDTNDILIENQLASGSFSDAEVEDIDISDLLNRSGPVERKKFKSGRARDERKRLLALRPVEFEEILSERSDDDASLDEHDISHSTSPSEIHEQSGENDLRKYNKNYGEDSDHTGDKSPTMVERSGRKNYKRYGRKNFERSGRKSVVRSGRKNLERSGRKKFPENNENYSEIDGLSGNGGSETFERSGKKTLERSGRKIFAENNENYGDINELSGSGSPETSERSGRKNMEKSGRKNLEKSGRKNLEGSRRRFERSGRRKLSDNYDNRGENNVRLSKEQDLSSFNADGSSSIYESTKLEIPAYPCFASKRKRGNFDTFTDALNSESMAISQNSPDENVSGNSHSSYSSDANSSKSRKKLIFANEINGKNKPDGAMEGDIMQKKGKRSSKGSNSSKSDSVESQDSRVLQSYPALPKKKRKTLPVSTNAKTEGKYQDTNDILIENQLASGSFSDAEVEDIDISDLLNRSGPVERKKFKSGRARDERKRLLALRPVEFEEILSERSDDDASLDEHDISHSTSPSEIHEQSGENDLRKYNKNYGEDSDHTGDKSPTMVERSGRKNYKRYGRKNFERSGRKSVVRSGRKNLERSGRKKFPENNENYSEIDGLSGNGGSETFERSGKKTLERSGRKIFAENNENYGDINELSGSGSPETSERSGRKNMEKSGRKNLEKSGRKNLEGSRRRFERSGRRKLSDNYDNRGENNVRLSKEQDLSSFNADGSSSIYESTKLEIPAYPCFASKRKRGNFDTFTDALNSESMAISQNSPDENVSGNSHSSYSSDANSSKSRKKLIFANEINGKNKPDGAMEGDIMQKKGKRSSKGSNSSKSDSVESQDSRVLQSYPALPKKKRKTLPVSTNAFNDALGDSNDNAGQSVASGGNSPSGKYDPSSRDSNNFIPVEDNMPIQHECGPPGKKVFHDRRMSSLNQNSISNSRSFRSLDAVSEGDRKERKHEEPLKNDKQSFNVSKQGESENSLSLNEVSHVSDIDAANISPVILRKRKRKNDVKKTDGEDDVVKEDLMVNGSKLKIDKSQALKVVSNSDSLAVVESSGISDNIEPVFHRMRRKKTVLPINASALAGILELDESECSNKSVADVEVIRNLSNRSASHWASLSFELRESIHPLSISHSVSKAGLSPSKLSSPCPPEVLHSPKERCPGEILIADVKEPLHPSPTSSDEQENVAPSSDKAPIEPPDSSEPKNAVLSPVKGPIEPPDSSELKNVVPSPVKDPIGPPDSSELNNVVPSPVKGPIKSLESTQTLEQPPSRINPRRSSARGISAIPKPIIPAGSKKRESTGVNKIAPESLRPALSVKSKLIRPSTETLQSVDKKSDTFKSSGAPSVPVPAKMNNTSQTKIQSPVSELSSAAKNSAIHFSSPSSVPKSQLQTVDYLISNTSSEAHENVRPAINDTTFVKEGAEISHEAKEINNLTFIKSSSACEHVPTNIVDVSTSAVISLGPNAVGEAVPAEDLEGRTSVNEASGPKLLAIKPVSLFGVGEPQAISENVVSVLAGVNIQTNISPLKSTTQIEPKSLTTTEVVKYSSDDKIPETQNVNTILKEIDDLSPPKSTSQLEPQVVISQCELNMQSPKESVRISGFSAVKHATRDKSGNLLSLTKIIEKVGSITMSSEPMPAANEPRPSNSGEVGFKYSNLECDSELLMLSPLNFKQLTSDSCGPSTSDSASLMKGSRKHSNLVVPSHGEVSGPTLAESRSEGSMSHSYERLPHSHAVSQVSGAIPKLGHSAFRQSEMNSMSSSRGESVARQGLIDASHRKESLVKSVMSKTSSSSLDTESEPSCSYHSSDESSRLTEKSSRKCDDSNSSNPEDDVGRIVDTVLRKLDEACEQQRKLEMKRAESIVQQFASLLPVQHTLGNKKKLRSCARGEPRNLRKKRDPSEKPVPKRGLPAWCSKTVKKVFVEAMEEREMSFLEQEKYLFDFADTVKLVIKSKDASEVQDGVISVQKQLFDLTIVKTLGDFFQFVRTYLPYEFRCRSIPCTGWNDPIYATWMDDSDLNKPLFE